MQTVKQGLSLLMGGILLTLSGCGSGPTANFQKLQLPNRPNYYLVCPEKYCSVTPNAYSPVYPVSADDLFNAWNQMVTRQLRVNYTFSIPEQGQYGLVQHSLIFGFPDDITVQFIALSDNQSSLAVLSQSRYGFYDFGTNKRRVQSWLQQLDQIVMPQNVSKSGG